MRKFNIGILLLFFFAVFLCPVSVLADGGGTTATAPAIFGKLAEKAGVIGNGLRGVGYIIAGLGLIFFSFMAIFNKISWKTLGYIMVSCFFLTAIWAIIDAAATKGDIDVQLRATGVGEKIEFPMGVPPVQ